MYNNRKVILLNFLALIVSLGSFGQSVDFKLIKAIKTNQLIIDRELASESLVEKDILPDGKNYLIVTAEVSYQGKKSFRLKKEEVSIGKEKKLAVGYLKLTQRGNLRWGFSKYVYEGKNLFNAVFIIDANLSKTKLHIKNQSFAIPKIVKSDVSPSCAPKATIEKKAYLNEISFKGKYRRADNQPFTKKITPKNGKLLSVSVALEFCDDPTFFKKTSFSFEMSYFQLENANGILFNCLGSFRFGKFYAPTTYNMYNRDKLTPKLNLIFNVPKEGKYVLKYLGKKIADL